MNNRIIGIVIGTFCIISLALIPLYIKGNREIKKFERTCGLPLPKGTKVIFKKNTYGALGDGELLYIYDLSHEGYMGIISAIEQKGGSGIIKGGWSRLPIDIYTKEKLEKKIGIPDGEIAKHINLNLAEGYWYFKNDLVMYNENGKIYWRISPYRNFSLIITDNGNRRIYLYQIDM